MPYLILACAVVSLLLMGCSSTKERQERAQRILDTATEKVADGIENVQSIHGEITKTVKNTAETIQEGAAELQERADQIQKGAKQVTDAISQIQEGTEAVKGALNVSGR